MNDTHNRRKEDTMPEQTGQRIDDLIAKVEDPQIRATLALLSRIDHSLIENTRVTGAIATRLEEHITEFALHKNRMNENIATMRGAWWSGVWLVSLVFTVVTAFGGFVLAQYIKANDVQDQRLESLSLRMHQLEKELAKYSTRIGNGLPPS